MELKVFEGLVGESSTLYTDFNSQVESYFNKPYNYSKLVSLMSTEFSKILQVEFIQKVFQAKRALHNTEKRYAFIKIKMDVISTKFVIQDFRYNKKFRLEAIHNGLETESSIKSHIDFKKTDFDILYEEFSQYNKAVDTLIAFFRLESNNVSGILSQGKSMSYSGMKYNDETALFGYDTGETE